MNFLLNFRDAKPQDADLISRLAVRSKSYWGYSKEFIEACREELLVTEQLIKSDKCHYVIVESKERLLGYYAIENSCKQEYELEALFVEPEYIGQGIGKALISHAKNSVKKLGGKSLVIQGDPNAEKFYLAVGAKKIGSRESASIPGRRLPLFKIDLSDVGAAVLGSQI